MSDDTRPAGLPRTYPHNWKARLNLLDPDGRHHNKFGAMIGYPLFASTPMRELRLLTEHVEDVFGRGGWGEVLSSIDARSTQSDVKSILIRAKCKKDPTAYFAEVPEDDDHIYLAISVEEAEAKIKDLQDVITLATRLGIEAWPE